jgi:hypothetical protein
MKLKEMNTKWFSLIVLVLISIYASAQAPEELLSFNDNRLEYNKHGMLILGSWALGNMAVSSFKLSASSPETQAYHQMNIGWNAVNLVIAGFGYYSSIHASSDLSLAETILEQNSISKILLFNSALDIGYMIGGAYLMERSKTSDQENRLKGFGKAIIVNGAFLLVFDSIMYYLHASHESSVLVPILEGIHLGPQSVGFSWQF